jgi:arylsulfatase A-like enzyme
MRFSWSLALIACLSGCASPPPDAERHARRPNIVIILADDLGFSDLGCYGSEISTPNIDRLAREGVRLAQFYNAGRCCPSRACLLTGLYPHQAGVGHMVADRHTPSYQGYLNDRCVTIAEALKPSGYQTLMVGKWHVGNDRHHWPVDRGFDRSIALIGSGRHYFMIPPGRILTDGENPFVPPTEGFYITEYFSQKAVDFLDLAGRGEKPFFLYVAYTAPHWPLHARAEDIARYRTTYAAGWDALRQARHRRVIEEGLVRPEWPLSPRDPRVPSWTDSPDRPWQEERMAVYAAQVECLDRGVGRIVEKLRALGSLDNTLLLFLSDNGGCSEEITGEGRWLEDDIPKKTADGRPIRVGNTPAIYPGPSDTFTSYGVGWANVSNTPFRLYKSWVHEGGIATPFIACWPAILGPGGLIEAPGHLVDILPTCIDAAKAEIPGSRAGRALLPLEGRTLLPLLRGQARPEPRVFFWEHEGNRAVREGPWKLVALNEGDWELYNLDQDRTELRNRAAQEPGRVRDLVARYDEWARRSGVLPWTEGHITK